MAVLGTILGIANAGLAIGSTIKNAIEQRRKERIAKQQAEELKNQYKAEANKDPLANSANQKLIRDYDREAEKQMQIARASGVITGATPEAAAATQKAVAEGRSNLYSNIASSASERADLYNEKAREVEKEYNQFQQAQAEAAQESAMNGVINAGNALGSVVDSIDVKPKTISRNVTQRVAQNRGENSAKLKTATPYTKKEVISTRPAITQEQSVANLNALMSKYNFRK